MSSKLVGLVTVLLLVVALTGVVFRVFADDSTSSTLSSLFPIDQGVVDHILIATDQSEAELFNIGDSWRVQAYPAFQQKIDALMNSINLLEHAQLVSNSASNHRVFGVQRNQGTKVSFMAGGEVLETLIIGQWSPEAGLSYLRRPAEDSVYSLPFDLPAIYQPIVDSWRDPVIMNLPIGMVSEVSIQMEGWTSSIYRGEEGWVMVVDGASMPVESQRVFDVLTVFNPLVAIGFASEAVAGTLNLGEPEAIINLTTFDGDQFNLVFLTRDEQSDFIKFGEEMTIYVADRIALDGLIGALTTQASPIAD